MNKERIQELYMIATRQCEEIGRNEAWLFELKFAELIIRECLNFCDDHSEDKIRKHFGVEE